MMDCREAIVYDMIYTLHTALCEVDKEERNCGIIVEEYPCLNKTAEAIE